MTKQIFKNKKTKCFSYFLLFLLVVMGVFGIVLYRINSAVVHHYNHLHYLNIDRHIRIAVAKFYDTYDTLPGDINKDLIVGKKPTVVGFKNTDEEQKFWGDLEETGLFSKNNQGRGFIKELSLFYLTEANFPKMYNIHNDGHWVRLSSKFSNKEDNYYLTSEQASRADNRRDDSYPFSGKMIAVGELRCFKKNTEGQWIYNRDIKEPCLTVYIKVDFPTEK